MALSTITHSRRKGARKYSEEQILQIASKYRTRKDFRGGDSAAYRASLRYGIHDKACAKMEIPGSRVERYVYRLSNDVGQVYYGITHDLSSRESAHQRNPKLTTPFKMEKLTDLIPVEQACEIEKKLIAAAKRDKSIDCVNTSEGGEQGGGSNKWTPKAIAIEASKYTTFKDFTKYASRAYEISRSNGTLEEVCKHMIKHSKPNGFYRNNKERIMVAALKCRTKTEFERDYPGANHEAKRLGMYEEACSHMEVIYKRRTKEEIIEECKKYPTCKMLIEADSALHASARYHCIWEQATQHFISHKEYKSRNG